MALNICLDAAFSELILPVFPTTSRLLRDCQTLESTNKADQSWVIAVGDFCGDLAAVSSFAKNPIESCCRLLSPVWRPYRGAPATRQTAPTVWLGTPDIS
jgi:hypothetical protein